MRKFTNVKIVGESRNAGLFLFISLLSHSKKNKMQRTKNSQRIFSLAIIIKTLNYFEFSSGATSDTNVHSESVEIAPSEDAVGAPTKYPRLYITG